MVLSRGDPLIFLERPVSLILVVAIAGLVVLVALPRFQKKKEAIVE